MSSVEAPAGIRVGVVGAGIAGLAAAHRLQAGGCQVVVYEARPQVGGRALPHREGFTDGQHADLGPELATHGYHRFSNLCAELGVEMSEPINFDRADLDPAETAAEAMLEGGRLMLQGTVLDEDQVAELRAEIRAVMEKTPPESHELLVPWVRRARLSPTAATALITVGKMMSGTPVEYDSHHLTGPVWGAVRRVRGGVSRLAEALAAGLDVRLSTPVRSIRQGGGVFLTTETGESARFDRLLVAAPAHVVETIGFDPPLEQSRLAALNAYPTARGGKVVAQYEEGDAIRAALARGCFTDGPVHMIWANHYYDQGPAVVTGFIGFEDRHLLADPEVALPLLDETATVAVGSPVTRIAGTGTTKDWTADRWALAVTYYPGSSQQGDIVPRVARPANRVHFAGDYTDFWWTGTLEGAVRSGERGAAEILRLPGRIPLPQIDARLGR